MTENEKAGQGSGQGSLELEELRRFAGLAKEFWPKLLAALAGVSAASRATVVIKDLSLGRWKVIGDWPVNEAPSRLFSVFASRIEEVGTLCESNGEALLSLEAASPRASGHFAVGVRLKLLTSQTCVGAFLLSEVSEGAAREILARLRLVVDVPRSYQEFGAAQQAKLDIVSFANALDVMSVVNAEKHFLASALAFCNSLASRLSCDRVSLGWFQGGYVRLKTMSSTEKFNRQMAAVQLLEAAMDECLDQDEELLWPVLDEAQGYIVRDHEKFALDQRVSNICSLPLRLDSKAVAVVSFERTSKPFSRLEIEQLRVCCDQAVRRLADLERRDRWFAARVAAWANEKLALVLGPRHTWAKVTSLLIGIIFGALFLVRVPYRAEGNFLLKSDEVQFRTAPFEGYIEQVFVRPGDAVKTGDKLMKLVTRELELEEGAALAEIGRYQREAEKARATNGLADMRVSYALAEQASARLNLVRYRLNEATLRAPFDGVLVEGDLRERLAAPVKQGDALMKIARIDKLYVEAEVNERDVHDILGKEEGEIAFVSQPRLKFPVLVVKIEPAAFPRPDGNVFLVRCEFKNSAEKWWRPGMSGLCKLNVERRTLWWVLTHRTVDFLRMKLWW